MNKYFIRNILRYGVLLFVTLVFSMCATSTTEVRNSVLFTGNWKFNLGDVNEGYKVELNDSDWRVLNLPHDWSIEGEFREDNPATAGGGALPGGIGWYRKSFTVNESDKDRLVFIEFDGVYRNSEVWINGEYLGKRPYGYSSFMYELTPFLKYGQETNLIAVKVDNSQQPNSRWYSGSGIYRNVRLVTTDKIYVDHWGTFITTPEVSESSAKVSVKINVKNASGTDQDVIVKTVISDSKGKEVRSNETPQRLSAGSVTEVAHKFTVENPKLWSIDSPNLYTAVTTISNKGNVIDDYKTTFGIRFFEFNVEKGFILNGEQVKIKGVCNHHDLGCLGAAVNTRAIERQLEILKGMGCNGIRTSHNPPAPELLDLCDKMGFIVMDEAFDMWAKKKTEFDYANDWDEWHKRDLEDMVLRDRNHPSVFMWSIGNEVLEQWDKKDSSGILISRELTSIVKALDNTRPVTANCNGVDPDNPLFASGALDLIGFSYHQQDFLDVPTNFPGKPFIGSETESSLHTRGSYDMPSDSVRRWPRRWDEPFHDGNADYSCSSYDNCSAPWGSTHEETWSIVKNNDFISGMYTWTGFDYLGEPTPYGWPAKSSYFGIIDLAGFPKDAYYLYKSEWTDEPVLHVFPHWNLSDRQAGWKEGQSIDVWAYTNCEEVELFLNDESMGIKKKEDGDFHLMWRLTYTPGKLKAIARTGGKEILVNEIATAGAPAKIILDADRSDIKADGKDLSFITVKVLDNKGMLAPYADNLINFVITGPGKIIGVDNGSQTSHEPFIADYRKAFNGMCLAVVKSTLEKGQITFEANSEGLEGNKILITTN